VVTECGLQNSALGIFVCVQLRHSPTMSVPSVRYALLMNVGAIAFFSDAFQIRIVPVDTPKVIKEYFPENPVSTTPI